MGRIGKLHADNIISKLPQFKLIQVADLYLDLQWLAQRQIAATHSIDELIQHKDIQAVLICSPSRYHVEHIIKAAQAGKHIFCEKPIGLHEKDIVKAIQIAKKAKVKLQIGFNRRFDQTFAKVQSHINNGLLKTPHIIKITSRDTECPSEEYVKNSGGLFMDMTIHDFDIARFMVGSEVTEVFAFGQNLISPMFAKYDDYDTAVIHLTFSNGTLGVIDNSRQAVYGYDQRIEVFSNKGCFIANNLNENNITFMGRDDVKSAKPTYFFLERYGEAFIEQLNSFYKAIHLDTEPLVSGYDGLQAIRIAFAAKASAKIGSPVSIETTL